MADTFDAILDRKEKTSFHVPGILSDKKDFDGPLDLLLYLISKNDANIYDLPISLITEQFLDYIEKNSTELEDLADFYRMAAELLYIKTKLLLPQETLARLRHHHRRRRQGQCGLLEFGELTKEGELMVWDDFHHPALSSIYTRDQDTNMELRVIRGIPYTCVNKK